MNQYCKDGESLSLIRDVTMMINVYAVIRVHWFHQSALCAHWKEEKVICSREMERQVLFHIYHKKKWEKDLPMHHQVNPILKEQWLPSTRKRCRRW